MQFRIFDGDMERWDEEEINLSPEELRRRFGNLANGEHTIPCENGQISADSGFVGIDIPTYGAPEHKIGTPEFDIYDQDLADKQFADFLKAGDDSSEE